MGNNLGNYALCLAVLSLMGLMGYTWHNDAAKINKTRDLLMGTRGEKVGATAYDTNRDGFPDYIEVNGEVYMLKGIESVGNPYP